MRIVKSLGYAVKGVAQIPMGCSKIVGMGFNLGAMAVKMSYGFAKAALEYNIIKLPAALSPLLVPLAYNDATAVRKEYNDKINGVLESHKNVIKIIKAYNLRMSEDLAKAVSTKRDEIKADSQYKTSPLGKAAIIYHNLGYVMKDLKNLSWDQAVKYTLNTPDYKYFHDIRKTGSENIFNVAFKTNGADILREGGNGGEGKLEEIRASTPDCKGYTPKQEFMDAYLKTGDDFNDTALVEAANLWDGLSC